MKQLKTFLFATALCIGAVSFTQAQSKVAHINTQELVAAMPEAKAAQAELETLSKTYDTDYKSMVTEYQNKEKQYVAEGETKTEEENARRGQELGSMRQNIQQFQGQAAQEIQKKQEELMKPITEKALAAINKVAKAQGFQYVLDRASLIMADGKDLLEDVKKELGI